MVRKVMGFVMAAGLLSSAMVWAGEFWQEKPYTQWTAKQCESMLTKSPWAFPHALTNISTPAPMRTEQTENPPRVSFPSGDPGGMEVHLFLQIRFVTADAIKAAIGQKRILANPGHESLKPQVAEYVNQPPLDEIIVEVTFYSKPAGHSFLRSIEAFFRTNTLEQLKSKFYLSHSKSDTYLQLTRYFPPGEGQPGALLCFPRYDQNGKPHFEGSEKSILLSLETDFARVEQQFHPKDMFFKGKFTL